jgi:uncharacterized tellurite resistance protein B-like protein
MRTYPKNSPQAAARIVVMTMMADGHVSKTELESFERTGARWVLGLQPGELQTVVQAYCEDLLMDAYAGQGTACGVDSQTVQGLLREIDSPPLRAKVQRICAMVVQSDAHVAHGESVVLQAAEQMWGPLAVGDTLAQQANVSVQRAPRELSVA